MTVRFYANAAKSAARAAARRLVAVARRAGLSVSERGACDAVVALGGDGTILRAVRRFPDVPVLGFNLGSLGYLASVGEGEFDAALALLASGSFSVSERTMLEVDGTTALNDVVIMREMTGHAAVLDLAANGSSATRYMADGVVVATPTGSTAYSLAAGGPVLMPDSRSFVVTPMNPHALGVRPMVVSDSVRLRVTSRRHVNASGESLGVYADGEHVRMLKVGETVEIAKSARSAKLIELEGYDPYEVLNRKLGWSKMTIEELNEAVDAGEIDELIRVCEARQVKALSALADRICAQAGVRLVLLCGGSSAGKTTTAKRLCTQLRVNGATALHMSTDDYFVGDARNPRHPDGTFDYETIEAVDSARLAADVNALLAGKEVHLRRFDFINHEGFDSEGTTSIPEKGYIVLEGIHALNPILTEAVPEPAKFRIFIEPKTQLTIFALTKLPPQDGRLLRRLVRDNQFRKMSPLETFNLWPQVLDGEEKWINPYRQFADAEFDSGLEYELAVLKPFVGGLVELVRRRRPEEKKAYIFTELFEVVHPAHPTAVPGDSILRETIGGSQLEY